MRAEGWIHASPQLSSAALVSLLTSKVLLKMKKSQHLDFTAKLNSVFVSDPIKQS